MGSIDVENRPHAVCIPFPAQGHINPMLKVAKLLHHKGFHITFVNSEFNKKRLLKSRGPNALDGLPTFRFETIPDGLPPTDANVTQDIGALCISTMKTCFPHVKQLLSKLNSSPDSPPVTCLVSDGAMTFSLDAAEELGIPRVLLWTTSACGFMAYLQCYRLMEKDLMPLTDARHLAEGYLETVVDWVPGVKEIRLKDFPSFMRVTEADHPILEYVIHETKRAEKPSAILVNTFDALEHEIIDAFSAFLPPVYPIGPLHLLTNQIPPDSELKSIGSNLWTEEPECLTWLDTREPNSVVYVNFGSIMVMSSEQLIEFAWGLANSEQAFLWVIRPDLVGGDSAVVPAAFAAETKGRGLLTTWCPQEQVLSHPAVGGFLTHSGWNSTLEAVCEGVPMICYPFFAEQQTNCRFTCKEWGIGLEIEGEVKRDYVEGLVRKLMEGEEGKEMRNKALEWGRLAKEAAAGPHGKSFVAFDNVVNQVLLEQGK